MLHASPPPATARAPSVLGDSGPSLPEVRYGHIQMPSCKRSHSPSVQKRSMLSDEAAHKQTQSGGSWSQSPVVARGTKSFCCHECESRNYISINLPDVCEICGAFHDGPTTVSPTGQRSLSIEPAAGSATEANFIELDESRSHGIARDGRHKVRNWLSSPVTRPPRITHQWRARLESANTSQILAMIEASVRQELLPQYTPVVAPEILPTATTLGLAYDDSCIVTGVLIGGPAFLSRRIAVGDMILAVNEVSLTGIHGVLDEAAIMKLVTGDDIPGTECLVKYHSAASGLEETVVLTRMPNNVLAHKRQMMAVFETLQLRLKAKYNDRESLGSLDIALDLWTKTLLSQHALEEECASNIATMRQEVLLCRDRLRTLLELERAAVTEGNAATHADAAQAMVAESNASAAAVQLKDVETRGSVGQAQQRVKLGAVLSKQSKKEEGRTAHVVELSEVLEFRDAELSIALIMSEERRQQIEHLKTLYNATQQQCQSAAHHLTRTMIAREAERRIETCRRVVKRMMRQQLAASWTCFVDTVMTRKSNREAVSKVTCTLTAPLFVRSWSLCIASVSVHTCRECLGAYRAQLGTD